jgi:hypothetical protein
VNRVVKITGQISADDDSTQYSITVGYPERKGPTDDFACTIESTGSISLRCQVFGILPQYAMRSAIEIATMTVSQKIVNHLTDTIDG